MPQVSPMSCVSFIACLLLMVVLDSCQDHSAESGRNATSPAPAIPLINYTARSYFPHDTTSYTEGLLIHNGELYESTGHVDQVPSSRSLFGVVDLHTGKITVKAEKEKYFGEGISFLNNKVYQLTYKTQVGFIYDAGTFKQLDTFRYANREGWGLTTDGTQLIMSDGTDELTFFDPIGFRPLKKLKVTENGVPRDSLNELEYIRGFLYANIWYNNHIVKIDLSNGKVVGELDLGELAADARQKHPDADALNGIAYDSATDKIYVTGKLWPNIYEIDFLH